MKIITHQKVNQILCGTPILVGADLSQVELRTTRDMTVDQTGLIHGGFVFGLADYAAMLAVNHPYVVLGSAVAKFLKPVKTNERLLAEARVSKSEGKQKTVEVIVTNRDRPIFKGQFTCFVLERHVLDQTS